MAGRVLVVVITCVLLALTLLQMNVYSSMSSPRLTFWDTFTSFRCPGFLPDCPAAGSALFILLDRFACSWLCSFHRVCSFRGLGVDDQSRHLLDRLHVTEDIPLLERKHRPPPLLLTSCMRSLARYTCTATTVAASVALALTTCFSWPRAVFVQDLHCLLLVVMVESPPPLLEQLVLLFVARVMTPAIVPRDCLGKLSSPLGIWVINPPSAESSIDSAVRYRYRLSLEWMPRQSAITSCGRLSASCLMVSGHTSTSFGLALIDRSAKLVEPISLFRVPSWPVFG